MSLARSLLLPLLPPREGWGEEPSCVKVRRPISSGMPLSPFVPHGKREFSSRAKHIRSEGRVPRGPIRSGDRQRKDWDSWNSSFHGFSLCCSRQNILHHSSGDIGEP